MPQTLPDLPYDYNALEPHIDEQTMRIHHDKHHQTYVDKLNDAIKGTEWEDKPVEEILKNFSSIPDDKKGAVKSHAGGHCNHSIFWTIMGPGGGGAPSGRIGDAINSTFGSYDAFKEQLTKAAVGQFGSGWGWLIADSSGKLSIKGYPNQDSPYMDGMTPILGVDVWEHAYYLKYQNKRPDYVAAWFNTINWKAVAERYK